MNWCVIFLFVSDWFPLNRNIIFQIALIFKYISVCGEFKRHSELKKMPHCLLSFFRNDVGSLSPQKMAKLAEIGEERAQTMQEEEEEGERKHRLQPLKNHQV